MRTLILGLVVLTTLAAAPAAAEFAGQDLPDLGGLRSVFDDIASGKTDASPLRDSNGLIGSNIAVPDTGAWGNMAKAIAAPMSQELGDPKLSATFEKAFIDGIGGVEDSLPQMGFAKRDYGVGFALFYIMTWELANGVELDPAVAKSVGEKLVTAVRAAGEFESVPAEHLDAGYDMFLTVPVAVLGMVQAYEEQGLTAEAAQMREFAGDAFEQVVGMSPYDIDIDASGKITGY